MKLIQIMCIKIAIGGSKLDRLTNKNYRTALGDFKLERLTKQVLKSNTRFLRLVTCLS